MKGSVQLLTHAAETTCEEKWCLTGALVGETQVEGRSAEQVLVASTPQQQIH